MAHRIANRVLETCSAPGTAAFALAGAVLGFQRFNAIPSIAVNDTVPYLAEGVDSNGVPNGGWEAGIGTYSSTNTLTRTTVLASSNAGAAVNFTGTTYVFCGSPAERSVYLDNNGTVLLPGATAEPPLPDANTLYLYAREIVSGLVVPRIRKPSGPDQTLQVDIGFSRAVKCVGSNNAVITVGAANFTFAGTAAAVTPAAGSCKSATQRARYSSAATAGAATSFVAPNAGACPVFRGSVAGEGGFRIVLRFSLQTLQSGNRFFAGIAASTTAQTGAAIDPNTTAAPARIGLCFNANTGNWQMSRGDGAAAPTLIDLGSNFPLDTTSMIELVLFCRPHNGSAAGDISYRVRRFTTASDNAAFETSGTLSSNLPAATTLLHPYGFFSNNATAAAVSWEFTSFAIESDW